MLIWPLEPNFKSIWIDIQQLHMQGHALALELRISCTNPSICRRRYCCHFVSVSLCSLGWFARSTYRWDPYFLHHINATTIFRPHGVNFTKGTFSELLQLSVLCIVYIAGIQPWPHFSPATGIFIIKIRRPWDRLSFIMIIDIQIRRHFYHEVPPGNNTLNRQFQRSVKLNDFLHRHLNIAI